MAMRYFIEETCNALSGLTLPEKEMRTWFRHFLKYVIDEDETEEFIKAAEDKVESVNEHHRHWKPAVIRREPYPSINSLRVYAGNAWVFLSGVKEPASSFSDTIKGTI